MVKLGVLVSGSGSNLQAIIDNIEAGHLNAQIKIVISNVPEVFALERARKHGLPALVIRHKDYKRREDFDQKLVEVLKAYEVELVILAGFYAPGNSCPPPRLSYARHEYSSCSLTGLPGHSCLAD